MKKKTYLGLVMEIIELDNDDVILTSGFEQDNQEIETGEDIENY